MKSSGSNCSSVVDPKCWTSSGPPAPPCSTRGATCSLPLNLHLLQVFVGRVFVTMILHLVQVTLFWGEHRVNLEEQRWRTSGGKRRRTAQGIRSPELHAEKSPGDQNQPSIQSPLGGPNKSWWWGHRRRREKRVKEAMLLRASPENLVQVGENSEVKSSIMATSKSQFYHLPLGTA